MLIWPLNEATSNQTLRLGSLVPVAERTSRMFRIDMNAGRARRPWGGAGTEAGYGAARRGAEVDAR